MFSTKYIFNKTLELLLEVSTRRLEEEVKDSQLNMPSHGHNLEIFPQNCINILVAF